MTLPILNLTCFTTLSICLIILIGLMVKKWVEGEKRSWLIVIYLLFILAGSVLNLIQFVFGFSTASNWIFERIILLSAVPLAAIQIPIYRQYFKPEQKNQFWPILSSLLIFFLIALNFLQPSSQALALLSRNPFLPWPSVGFIFNLAAWLVFITKTFLLVITGYRETVHPLHKNRQQYWLLSIFFFISGSLINFFHHPLVAYVLLTLNAIVVTFLASTHGLPDIRRSIRLLIKNLIKIFVSLLLYALLFGFTRLLWSSASSTSILWGSLILAGVLLIFINPIVNHLTGLISDWFAEIDYDRNDLVTEYSQQIANILQLDRLAKTISDLLQTHLKASRVLLFLVSKMDDSGTYRLEPVDFDPLLPTKIPIGLFDQADIFAINLSTIHHPITQYDIDILPAYTWMPIEEKKWLSSLALDVFVPIQANGEWIGLLGIGPKQNGHRYFEEDTSLLELLADQTAIGLENARLYADLQYRNTENERLYNQLKSANEELSQLDKAKSNFISIASHELRTPLTQIIGYNDMIEEMIKSNLAANSPEIQMVTGVRKAARRLEEIIDSMFDISRLDTRTLELNLASTSLFRVMKAAAEKWIDALIERNIDFSIEGVENIPNITADSARLIQVFTHLVQNAIKSTPDNGKITIHGRIIVPQKPADPVYVEIVIADTGVGISHEDIEKIFTKFYRVGDVLLHSTGETKFKGAGPGLGLTIARGIVEAHNGRIWAESAGFDELTCPGSKFVVLLPVSGPESNQPVV